MNESIILGNNIVTVLAKQNTHTHINIRYIYMYIERYMDMLLYTLNDKPHTNHTPYSVQNLRMHHFHLTE